MLTIVSICLLFLLILYLALNRGAGLFQRSTSSLKKDATSINELWNAGHYSEITEIAEERLNVDPMDRNALLFSGYSRYLLAISRLSTEERNTDLDMAIQHLRLLLAQGGTPNPEQVYYVLGKAYLAKGFYWSDLAVEYLNAALDSGYEPEDIFEHLGQAYSALGDSESALKWYDLALSIHPTDRLLLTLGRESFKLGQYDKSAKFYHRAIEMSHDDSLKKEGLSQLSKLYYDIGNYKMARGILENLVSMESGNEEYVFLLAETYQKLGLDADARRLWFKVTRINPGHVGALRRLYD